MAVNPRAVSTGEGKGLAKVIKPLESDYYDKKYAEAKERKGEAKKSMAAAMSKTPWSRDMSLFKDKVSELKNFYNTNAKSLMEGDFDAQVQLEAMQNEIVNFAEQSKASEKYHILNEKAILNDPTGFYGEDVKTHRSFANTPGDFGTYGLRGRFDKNALLEKVAKRVGELEVDYEDPYIDNDIKAIINKGSVPQTEVGAVVKQEIDGIRQAYPDQTKDLTDKEVFDYAKGFAEQKQSFAQQYQNKPSAGERRNFKKAKKRLRSIWRMRNDAITTGDEIASLNNQYDSRSKLTTTNSRRDTSGDRTMILMDLVDKNGETQNTIKIAADAPISEWNAFLNRFSGGAGAGFDNVDQDILDELEDYSPFEGELISSPKAPETSADVVSLTTLIQKIGDADFINRLSQDKLTDDDQALIPSEGMRSAFKAGAYQSSKKNAPSKDQKEIVSSNLSRVLKPYSFQGQTFEGIELIDKWGGIDEVKLTFGTGDNKVEKTFKADDRAGIENLMKSLKNTGSNNVSSPKNPWD